MLEDSLPLFPSLVGYEGDTKHYSMSLNMGSFPVLFAPHFQNDLDISLGGVVSPKPNLVSGLA